ncbi:MBL fold metallo-hydrolase [Halieaceae bacterium IMCC14734]|uniref:MBL fold metallo-hydrolase n=1 Tax=Candidatus Litorirhabdus singularis TaxID=2518993 RepID=A0ABT3TGN8_9GAMM|nr:MBL fold metallo-hydrolase [Candidatus Litorirhabdus singularis]MCX2980579.1 MBL fold metallo-hydrolase [Candidatus Litorirhabdus singularis]
MRKWQIGEVTVTKIVEMETTGGASWILPDASPAECRDIEWLKPNFMDEEGELKFSVHALVVETPSCTIVVDTCVGNDKERKPFRDWHQLQTSFLQDFAGAGFDRDTVDHVLCTHLHVDHVGWNTMWVDGAWVPTFSNASYLVAQDEYDHFSRTDIEEINQRVFNDSVAPVYEAGLMQLVATDHQVCPEVDLVPTLGHTPGHVSVRIRSGGEQALITGDFVHHPCQMARLDWGSSADLDAAAADATRRRVFAEYADTPTLIIGTHFAGVTAGHIVRDGDAFRLQT